jgi:hypothetical protein
MGYKGSIHNLSAGDYLRRASCEIVDLVHRRPVMAPLQDREFLINKIAKLQQQQLTMNQEAKLNGWTREQSALVFDTRIARIASLLRELTALDDAERS